MSGKRNRRVPSDLKAVQDERLTCRHIQTLVLLQQATDENEDLKRRFQILEKEIMSCQELHKLARDSEKTIHQMEENHKSAVESALNKMQSRHNKEYGQLLEAKNLLATASHQKLEELEMKIKYLEAENKRQELLLENQMEEAKVVKSLEVELQDACSKLSLIEKSKIDIERELAANKKREAHHSLEKDKYEKKIAALELKVDKLTSRLELELSSKKMLLERNELLQHVEKQRCQIEAMSMEKQQFERDFDDMSSQIHECKMKIVSLEKGNSMLELERDALSQSSTDLKTEVAYLKNKEASHRSSCGDFNEYVSIKKELALLKEENIRLKSSRSKPELRTLKSVEPKGRVLKSASFTKRT